VGSLRQAVAHRRFTLVILDSRGRQMRRVRVASRALAGAVMLAAALVVTGAALVAHGVWRHHTAEETRRIARENAELKTLIASLEDRLPSARLFALRGEMTFAQIWSKSGLGSEPSLLGIGPVEGVPDGAPVAAATPAAAASETTPGTGSLLDVDPVALPLELDRIESDGKRLQRGLGELLEYFHDAERLLSNTPSINPARTPWLTSSFGRRRDPMNGQILMHKGIDLGGRIGQDIFAPADAVVIFVGLRGGYGRVVVLDHGFGLQTHFAHLSKFRCKVGDRVKRGEVIAEMGSTGKSTGPHLHYEVRRMGQPLDPRAFVLD
jgi:murein DD-endopeptidase MepM/ murein hydrolase activator NlpD